MSVRTEGMHDGEWLSEAETRTRLDRTWDQGRGVLAFFSTVDHKRVAKRYFVTAFVFFFLAGLLALTMRLDYLTARDSREDAARKVDVAADALKAQVDLVASAGVNSGPGLGRGFVLPDFERYRWDAGLNVDLPFERTAQRNSYRTALITSKQAERELVNLEDNIRLQVREGWRALDQAKRNYEISELRVKLSERRVEEQDLLSELGRGVAKDQVDAQNDLVSAKNQRTQALVAHTIARLQFWNSTGILYIKENGKWEEVSPTGK